MPQGPEDRSDQGIPEQRHLTGPPGPKSFRNEKAFHFEKFSFLGWGRGVLTWFGFFFPSVLFEAITMI